MRTCQTIHGEARCGQKATHMVRGRSPFFWSGYHCRRHTQSMVTNYDHQGGCEVIALSDKEESFPSEA